MVVVFFLVVVIVVRILQFVSVAASFVFVCRMWNGVYFRRKIPIRFSIARMLCICIVLSVCVVVVAVVVSTSSVAIVRVYACNVMYECMH